MLSRPKYLNQLETLGIDAISDVILFTHIAIEIKQSDPSDTRIRIHKWRAMYLQQCRFWRAM
jgi:hypothetical protein